MNEPPGKITTVHSHAYTHPPTHTHFAKNLFHTKHRTILLKPPTPPHPRLLISKQRKVLAGKPGQRREPPFLKHSATPSLLQGAARQGKVGAERSCRERRKGNGQGRQASRQGPGSFGSLLFHTAASRPSRCPRAPSERQRCLPALGVTLASLTHRREAPRTPRARFSAAPPASATVLRTRDERPCQRLACPRAGRLEGKKSQKKKKPFLAGLFLRA